MLIAGAMGKADASGNLTDEPARQAIAAERAAPKAWTLEQRP